VSNHKSQVVSELGCGIFGIYKHKGHTEKDLRPLVTVLLKNSQVRGHDACGYAYKLGNVIHFDKDGITPEKFIEAGRIQKIDPNFEMLIGHTRHGTSGDPKFNRNNHPLISDETGEVYAYVHNGVVYSRYEGKRDVGAEVDTAVMRAEVNDRLEGKEGHKKMKLPQAIKDALENLGGSMTTAWISATRDVMYFTKISNPLFIAHLPDLKITVFASTKEILEGSLEDFFPKILGVFHPWFLWEAKADTFLILSNKGIKVAKLDRKTTGYYGGGSWSTLSWKDKKGGKTTSIYDKKKPGTQTTFITVPRGGTGSTYSSEPGRYQRKFKKGDKVVLKDRTDSIYKIRTWKKEYEKFRGKEGVIETVYTHKGKRFFKVLFEVDGKGEYLEMTPPHWIMLAEYADEPDDIDIEDYHDAYLDAQIKSMFPGEDDYSDLEGGYDTCRMPGYKDWSDTDLEEGDYVQILTPEEVPKWDLDDDNDWALLNELGGFSGDVVSMHFDKGLNEMVYKLDGYGDIVFKRAWLRLLY
jgi:hypothetical protein